MEYFYREACLYDRFPGFLLPAAFFFPSVLRDKIYEKFGHLI